ncbi:MAG: MFS transporter, partial [Variibacter sp.]|nr:MFS transporter [Variibacter sp.]
MRSDRWIVLVVLLLVRTAMGFQFQTVGAIGAVLVDAFAIDYARLGTLIGLYLLPGIVIALPSGMLGDRFGVKTVALAGLALMAAGGLLSAVAPSFGVLVLARLVSGTGAVLVNVAVTTMTSDWFLGRELRTAMAVVVASWPLGLALGLVVFPPLALGLGWQAVMIAGAGACLLMLALLGAAYRDPPELPVRHAAALPLNLIGCEWRLVLTAGLIWGVYNVAYILLISFVPNLFVAQGYTALAATGLASLLGWALIGMVPVGGVLADRSHRADLVMVASFGVTAVAVVLL